MSICYYHNDLDGKCAAAIVLKKYSDCRMREIDYKDDPDFTQEVMDEEWVFIVDFSLKPEKMDQLLAVVGPESIIWIDHHRTAMDYKYQCLPIKLKDGITERWPIELKGIREEGKSGCVLTWEYLYPNIIQPWVVRWIGDRDVWAWEYGEDTKLFTAGMLLQNCDPTNTLLWRSLFDDDSTLLDSILNNGELVIKNRAMYAKSCRGCLGYKVIWEKQPCFIINMPMTSTEDFGEYYANYLCIGMSFDGKQWTVSMRSKDPDICDVSKIAKKYGGGGHPGAAGFVCNTLPWENNA